MKSEIHASKGNLGKLDQLVRITGGMLVILFGLLLESWWGALGFIPLLTGLAGWCPAYALFGVTTRGNLHRTRGKPRLSKQG